MLLQSTIFGPLFWMLQGILLFTFVIGLHYYFKDKNIELTIPKWLLIITYWLTINLTIAAGFTLIGEDESRAGIYFLGFFSVTLIIIGVVLRRFILKVK
ncbi:hypothetical protein [Carboxylicivirga sp. N1Y90]|uniref:hypothetical protein n=1 Tax=Carboxylicivirga fragile TaxID=3417571 RepID=UPI003D349FEA|nr:hypothetical protein [Marinilabiliaceae bacterium N1Y90]